MRAWYGLLASVAIAAPAWAIDPGTVKGTFEVNGKPIELKHAYAHLHDNGFARVRIGVGKPPGRKQGTDHVLRPPSKGERTDLEVAVQVAADAVELILAGFRNNFYRAQIATATLLVLLLAFVAGLLLLAAERLLTPWLRLRLP